MNQPQVHLSRLAPEPYSQLPPHPTSLGCHRALGWVPCVTCKFPLALYFTYGKAYVSIPLFPFVPPLLPLLFPQVCSLCLCLHCCPANRFISTIFLDSIVFLFLTYFTVYNRLYGILLSYKTHLNHSEWSGWTMYDLLIQYYVPKYYMGHTLKKWLVIFLEFTFNRGSFIYIC